MWAQLSIKTALPLTLSLINIHMEELDSYREGGDDSYRSNLQKLFFKNIETGDQLAVKQASCGQ